MCSGEDIGRVESARNRVGFSSTKLFAQLKAWNTLPNGKNAHFYNFWAGLRRKAEFRRKLAEDLTRVFQLLADGVLTPQVAAEFPLTEAATALALAESRTVAGKVILLP
jgi:NADPH:quinone reductase-like Zn-dependent oxidoreductase